MEEKKSSAAAIITLKIKPRRIVFRGRLYEDKEIADLVVVDIDTEKQRPYTVSAGGFPVKTYVTEEQMLYGVSKALIKTLIERMGEPDEIATGVYQDIEPVRSCGGRHKTQIVGVF